MAGPQGDIAGMQSKLGRVDMAMHALKMFLDSGAIEVCPESAGLMCYLVSGTVAGEKTRFNKGDPGQIDGLITLRRALTPQHVIWRWVEVVDEPPDALPVPDDGPLTDSEHEDALAGLDDADPLDGSPGEQ